MQFFRDIKQASVAAFELAKTTGKKAAVIKVGGESKPYCAVGNGWELNRMYYHGEGGKKMFFDVMATYEVLN